MNKGAAMGNSENMNTFYVKATEEDAREFRAAINREYSRQTEDVIPIDDDLATRVALNAVYRRMRARERPAPPPIDVVFRGGPRDGETDTYNNQPRTIVCYDPKKGGPFYYIISPFDLDGKIIYVPLSDDIKAVFPDHFKPDTKTSDPDLLAEPTEGEVELARERYCSYDGDIAQSFQHALACFIADRRKQAPPSAPPPISPAADYMVFRHDRIDFRARGDEFHSPLVATVSVNGLLAAMRAAGATQEIGGKE